MELVSQHTKAIMEGCKERARDAGLSFDDESLEYIVTNRDLIELSPKIMIPTLYDYWVHDVEVLREKGRYELYPGNPYETVINTRPAISFYNDNNPDWLNVMIFYHVLGHIDFFQNNIFFRHTWDYDFAGQALSDKRMIAKLRAEKGRWLDYVIEFTKGIDNLVGYHAELSRVGKLPSSNSEMIDFYFDNFLQEEKKVKTSKYIKEIDRLNSCCQKFAESGEQSFFTEVHRKYPEFETLFLKHQRSRKRKSLDLIQFLVEKSGFLAREENQWMRSVMEVIRNTSLFFQPQIRTKIMNEGWASYWHETLFLKDNRINGHEVDYARVNSAVTSMPRVGLNPYALGMRLFYYIEDMVNKGKRSFEYRSNLDFQKREKYNKKTGAGRQFIFDVRKNYSDSTFVSSFLDQDFIDKNKLFVVGKRLNSKRNIWEYYVKSRKAAEYQKMVEDSLYHPPKIEVSIKKRLNILFLNHTFEGKPLVFDFIANTMLGVEFFWGDTVQLETSEVIPSRKKLMQDSMGFMRAMPMAQETEPDQIRWRRVLFTMKKGKLTKNILD